MNALALSEQKSEVQKYHYMLVNGRETQEIILAIHPSDFLQGITAFMRLVGKR